MRDALRAYAIAAGCWLLWDLSLFAYGDKPYPWSLWWYEWKREFDFYPFPVIAALLLVVLVWLRLRQKRREKDEIEAISPAEGQCNDGKTSTGTKWKGALELGGAGAMLGLVAFVVCIFMGVLLGLVVPDVLEKIPIEQVARASKYFVGIPMSVFAGVGFVTARDRDPASIRPSDLLRGDRHWD
jgi:hypothetical protein